MADKVTKSSLLNCFYSLGEQLSIHQVNERLSRPIAERTLRRWLAEAVNNGSLSRTGNRKSTRYQKVRTDNSLPEFQFLQHKSEGQKQQILKQIRDLWTHTSTAIEGNTLTLGDTHFILEQGLTISGKPLREHLEILGHSRAIDLLYQSISTTISKQFFFELHKSIQTEIIHDIDKPYGAWKVRPNGTYTVGADNKPIYLEYALPQHVPFLMNKIIDRLNEKSMREVTSTDAHWIYAEIHAAVAHIHPFWDGNGRIARLVANIPLLKSGLPPIVIPSNKRREYIQLLAKYQFETGQLNDKSTNIVDHDLLKDFMEFCSDCYHETLKIIKINE